MHRRFVVIISTLLSLLGVATETSSAVLPGSSSRAEAVITDVAAAPPLVLASDIEEGDSGAAAAASAGAVGIATTIAVTRPGDLAVFSHAASTTVSANTFDIGWLRRAEAGFTYVAASDGLMTFTWDVTFAKEFWEVAGSYRLCAHNPCSGAFWSMVDDASTRVGSRHTGSGTFALSGGEAYQFTLFEGVSSSGYQRARSLTTSASIALSLPPTVVPLPASGVLLAAGGLLACRLGRRARSAVDDHAVRVTGRGQQADH